MFCPKCGKFLDDDEVFCSNCGTKIEDNTDDTVYQPPNDNPDDVPQKSYYQAQDTVSAAKVKKPVNKKLLAIIIAVCAVIIIAIIALVISNGRISAEAYIYDEINFVGYNGYATVTAADVFDYDGLMADLGQSNYSGTDSSIINSIVDYSSEYALGGQISVKFDKSENLSNGDEITATISINYSMINSLNYEKKLTGKDNYTKTYTVSGLEEANALDPFGVIESVNYDMVSESSSINFNEEYTQDFENYSAHYYNSSNGDPMLEIVNADNNAVAYVSYSTDSNAYSSTKKVTVNAEYQTTDYYESGLVIAPETKQYEPLISDYLRSADDVSAEAVSALEKDAADELESSYEAATLQKIDFLYKDDDYAVNAVVFIYSYTFAYDNSTLYIGVYAENIEADTNKEITNLDDIFFRRTSSSNSISEVEEELKSDGWSVSEISMD